MKEFLEKIHNRKKDKEEVSEEEQSKKTAVFFGFYFIFFVILFCVIAFGGDRNYLFQEYEKGTPSAQSAGLLENSFAYHYQVVVDDYTYGYAGERYGSVEKFVYNNQDYYHEGDQFLVNQSPWIACDNPYVLYEFLNADQFANLIQKATYVAKTEYEDGNIVYHYLISTNELNALFFNEVTEYEDSTNTIDITLNADGYITKVLMDLNEYGRRRDISQSKLSIEMTFSKFGEIKKIDNPIA